MKRLLTLAMVLATTGMLISSISTANACPHHRAMQPQFVQPFYVAAPMPVYQAPMMHQFQTIGGPAPTTYFDSAPVYAAPIPQAAPVAVQAPVYQAAPVQVAAPVQEVTVPLQPIATMEAAVETIRVEDTHPVEAIAETPIASTVEVAPVAIQYVEVAPAPVPVRYTVPVQYTAPVQYAAPAGPTFVETPPANRATIIETYYQPQMMHFQPAPIMMIQATPTRGHRHCRHH